MQLQLYFDMRIAQHFSTVRVTLQGPVMPVVVIVSLHAMCFGIPLLSCMLTARH